MRKRVADLGFEAVRRPGLWLLSTLRAVPFVRKRVIPVFLKEELEEIPPRPPLRPSSVSWSGCSKATRPCSSDPGWEKSASSCCTGFRS